MNLPLFLSNCCGDCPDRSKIPMLLYPKGHHERSPENRLRVPNISKSEIFYDCQTVESRRHISRRLSKSSSNIEVDNCSNCLKATASFMSIESRYQLKGAPSELVLKQCKKLLDTYSINLHSAWTEGVVMSVEDIELIHRIIRSNDRYKYLSPRKIEILKSIADKAEKYHKTKVQSKDSCDCVDQAWNVIKEIFRRNSNTRHESVEGIPPLMPTSPVEVSPTSSISDKTCDIDEYLALSDYDQSVNLDLKDLIDKISVDSLELPGENDYDMDYSQIFTDSRRLGDIKAQGNHCQSGGNRKSAKRPGSSHEYGRKPSLGIRKPNISPNLSYQNMAYEWYAFSQDVRRILRYVREKSALVGICVEYEIKCMTFDDLQRVGKFYKMKSQPDGLEVKQMSVDHIKRRPEELFDILKPSDISYLHRKVMADIEKGFGRLNEKLCKIQGDKKIVPELRKNKTNIRAMKRAPQRKQIPTEMPALKKIRKTKPEEKFYETISSSDESSVSCYKTPRATQVKNENFIFRKYLPKFLKS